MNSWDDIARGDKKGTFNALRAKQKTNQKNPQNNKNKNILAFIINAVD